MYFSDLKYKGFVLSQEEELEEDNRKIFHFITPPDGSGQAFVDYTPYSEMMMDDLVMFAEFYLVHLRFPTRRDINSNGPIHREQLRELMSR